MPRKSARRKAIEWMEAKVSRLNKDALHREILSEEDSIQDENMNRILKRMKKARYIFRGKKYRRRGKLFDFVECLDIYSKSHNDKEFLYNFRLTRESFFLLLEEIEKTNAFKNCRQKDQHPVAFQLLVFLWRIGKEGSGGGTLSVSSYFGIGKGSVVNYVRRCVKALHKFKDNVVYWPDEEEREMMKTRLSASGFCHCIGIIDRMLIVLDSRPENLENVTTPENLVTHLMSS
jgi:hypothetical protein